MLKVSGWPIRRGDRALVLSLEQLLEWVRIELVPEADPDVASIA